MTVSKSPRRPCLMERSVGVFCLQCLQVFVEFRYEPRRHGENGHVEWHHALWPNHVHCPICS